MCEYESDTEFSSDDGFDSDVEAMLYSQIHHDNSSYIQFEEKTSENVKITTQLDINVIEKEPKLTETEGTVKQQRCSDKRKKKTVTKKADSVTDVNISAKPSAKKAKRSLGSSSSSNGKPKTEKRKAKIGSKTKTTNKKKGREKKKKTVIPKKKKKSKDDDSKRSMPLKSNKITEIELRATCRKAMIEFYSNNLPIFAKNKQSQSNWDVLSEDLHRSRRARKGRFFSVCDTCHETGHESRSCPVACANLKCSLCGEGHARADCRNAPCRNCWGTGHRAMCCPTKSVWHTFCSRCNQMGHLPLQCSDNWRQFHSTINPAATKAVEGKELKRLSMANCPNCGRKGHFVHLCKCSRMGNPYPYLPYVTYYDGDVEPRKVVPNVPVAAYVIDDTNTDENSVRVAINNWKNVFDSSFASGPLSYGNCKKDLTAKKPEKGLNNNCNTEKKMWKENGNNRRAKRRKIST